MRLSLATLAGALALSGCTTLGGLSREQSAAVAPASPDGGNAVMVGGLAAGAFGEDLGSGDRRKALAAEYQALEFAQSGKPVEWIGSWSGRSGKVVPAQPYRVGSQDCRQYTHTITANGATTSARGTACRNQDGSWATLS